MARAEDFSLPHHPFRRFEAPATERSFVISLVLKFLQFTRKPSFERMSHEWLVNNEREFSRHWY